MAHELTDLTVKDIAVLFRNADVDRSGALEFGEFLAQFKRELSQDAACVREPFFWAKTRPRPLLKRADRVALEEKLFGDIAMDARRTSEELMALIQEQARGLAHAQ